MAEVNILQVVKVKPGRRITIPTVVTDEMKIKEGDHVAFIREKPGVRMVKVVLDLNNEGVK